MSKLNSRFSHLRINVNTEDIRNTSEKPKTNYFRDPNTYRIQSPKNINTMMNKPVQLVYTSPMTAKNENKNYAVNNFSKENQPSSVAKNGNFTYNNTLQNKRNDKIELSSKTNQKPNLLNIIKSNLTRKGNYNTNNNIYVNNSNNNNINYHILNNNNSQNKYSEMNHQITNNNDYNNNYNKQRNISNNQNNNYNSNINNQPLTTKSNSVSRENKQGQYSSLTNQLKSNNETMVNNNYNKKSSNENYNNSNLNFQNGFREIQGNISKNNLGNYLYSEGNAINNRSSSIRQNSNNNNNKNNYFLVDEINKNTIDNIQRNIKNLSNSINNNNNNNYNILSAKRDNYLQQNFFNNKSERGMKSLSPIVKLESALLTEAKKKMQLKNSLKLFSNNNNNNGNITQISNTRIPSNPNNLSGINNNPDTSRINYEDRVIHTDSSVTPHATRKLNSVSNQKNILNPVLSSNIPSQNKINYLNNNSNSNNINSNNTNTNNNNNSNQKESGKQEMIDIQTINNLKITNNKESIDLILNELTTIEINYCTVCSFNLILN